MICKTDVMGRRIYILTCACEERRMKERKKDKKGMEGYGTVLEKIHIETT